jgi:NAD-dependent dihydropyrimidine dehydrogenase PreA subunit
MLDKSGLDLESYDRLPRQIAGHADGAKSKATFNDLRMTFSEEQLKKETQRCLSCGATIVDETLCVGCGLCTTKCKFDAISLIREYNGVGAALPDMKPIVIRQIIKRKIRIAGKNVSRSVAGIFKN